MLLKTLRQFLHHDVAGGILLLSAACLAVVINNFEIHLVNEAAAKTLLFWINDGLMTVFFLLIGLELKREVLMGELSGIKRALLPGVAAVGGMLMPAIIYIAINWHNRVTLQGWAVPVATDIAFAMGVLSLFKKKVSPGLRLFLVALAIFDDVGAIIIIAIFHTHGLSVMWLIFSGLMFLILASLNRARVRQLWVYFIPGIALWVGILHSGVHATVAGLLIAFMIPLGPSHLKNSPLIVLEQALHPWVVYGVLPLFALANAGVSFAGMSWRDLLDPVTLGIVGGLFVGKQSGILLAVWLMVKAGWARLPAHTTWQALYGVALLCGIGFTMSLFIGTLAFNNELAIYMKSVRVGVLLASLLSGIMGAVVLARSVKNIV